MTDFSNSLDELDGLWSQRNKHLPYHHGVHSIPYIFAIRNGSYSSYLRGRGDGSGCGSKKQTKDRKITDDSTEKEKFNDIPMKKD